MPSISGTILDDANAPAVGRIVRVYRRDTGALLGSDITDAAGAYSIVTESATEITIPFTAVRLLAHFEGANGARTYIDSSSYARTISESGSNENVTAHYKFGTSGVSLADGWLSTADNADLEPNDDDFCVDGWAKQRFAGWAMGIVRKGAASSGDWELTVNTSNLVVAKCRNSAGDVIADMISTTPMSTAFFRHIALDREGPTFRLFVDGQLEDEVTGVSAAIRDSAHGLNFGQMTGGTVANGWIYLDEWRYTIGYSRWSAPFDVPTAPGVETNEVITKVVGYSGECQRIVLDDDAGTVYNDRIKRVMPG